MKNLKRFSVLKISKIYYQEVYEKEPMDVNITKVLKLYLVTNRYDYSDEEFLGRIEKACQNGVTLVQLGEKEVTTHKYFELATNEKSSHIDSSTLCGFRWICSVEIHT